MSANSITVFFDGDCPVCSREVQILRRIDQDSTIRWVDIGELSGDELPSGKTREQLLGEMHVFRAGSGWSSGIDGFRAIWLQLPFLRRMAWIFRVPVLRQALQVLYGYFLRWQSRNRSRRLAES